MKNLTRKLFLSICTLAICAVTLVSTTFAWYTSSKEVDAEAITVSSSTATDSDLVAAIVRGDEVGPYTNYIDFAESDFNKVSLSPVHYSNGKFYDQKNGEIVVADDAKTIPYLKFTLSFRTKATPTYTGEGESKKLKSIPVYFTEFNLSTTLSTIKSFDNILATTPNAATGIDGATYSVDMLYATNMVINVGSVSTNYELDNFANEEKTTVSPTETANARTYYNAVMPNSSDLDSTKAPAANTLLPNSVKNINQIFAFDTLKADNSGYADVTVEFIIYLNGWDYYCYDACKGQTFTLDVKFSTDPVTE